MKRPLLFLCMLFMFYHVKSQSIPNFEQYTDDDGLSNGFVTCLYQDKMGFMWYGTANGLNRFDGYQFKSWTAVEGQANSLSHPIVWAIHGTNNGMIWLGTEKGLNRFDPKSETFTQYFHDPKDKQSLSHDHVYQICSDEDGNLWVSTEDGLNYLKKGSSRFNRYFTGSGPKATKRVGGLMRDAKGTLWFGINNTLFHFHPETKRVGKYQLPAEKQLKHPAANHIKAIFGDRIQQLWVGTDENGIYLFDQQSKQFKEHYKNIPGDKNSLADDRICIFLPDDRGNIWVGTYGGGMSIFNPKNGQIKTLEIDPFNPVHHNINVVRRMLKDQAGNIWLGTSYGGTKVALKHKKPFVNYQPIPGKAGSIGDGQLGQLSESANGSIWTPVDGWGLAALQAEGDQFIAYTPEQKANTPLDTKKVISVLEDQEGQVWALTFTELWARDQTSKQWRNLKPRGMPRNWLCSQLKDSQGRHWIGSQEGLYQYDPAQNAMIRIPLKVEKNDVAQGNNNYIEKVYEDPKGAIWIATHAGLNYSKDGQQPFIFYPFQSPILNIHMSKAGILWLGTTGGLAYFNTQNKTVTFHPKAKNLEGQLAISILEDNQERLWIGSRIGLICFDPKTGHTRIYNQKDGVVSKQFFNSALKARNGELYFGGIKGLLRFDPDKIRGNDFVPGIVLTRLQILNRDMPIKGSIGDTLEWKSPLQKNIAYVDTLKLLHWQNDFALEFAALDYTAPGNNRYKYQLMGYDQHWIKTDASRRFAHYTNLSPGWYQFKVMGSNNDGLWNQEARVLHIHIRPPWWARWWACSLWAILLGSLGYWVWRYELGRRLANAEASRLQHMDAFKSQLYTNITHEFRTPLTLILGTTDLIEPQVDAPIQESLEIIRRNGHQLLEQVNEMLDLSKLESRQLALQVIQGEVILYLRYLVESFQSLAKGKDIRLEYIPEIPELYLDFDPLRLQQIVSNVLSNAIKFTPKGGEVQLRVQQVGQQLQIQVSDTGIGIPEDKLSQVFDRFFQVDASNTRQGEGTGIGLALTKELVLLMQGEIQVFKRPEGGATFKVLLPISTKGEKIVQVLPLPKYTAKEQRKEVQMTPADATAPLLLIVEDNVDVVQYLQSCFNKRYRIEWARDGQEGVEKALDLVPDLILSDVMMPVKDGYELCHTLKSDARSSHIPIILLTAKADMDSKLDGLQRGADVYLSKPFHAGELLAQVHNLLDIRKKLQAYYLQQAGLEMAGATSQVPPPNLESGMEHEFIQKVRMLLKADLSKQWEVPELAQALQVSVSQLHRKLEALTGMHTTAFVRRVRLVKAKEKLLQTPKETIATIGYAVGFNSPNEFSRRFKEVFGMTPGEWREQGG